MTNRGIKEIYNQIIDEEIGKYYINLNKNDNNRIIKIEYKNSNNYITSEFGLQIAERSLVSKSVWWFLNEL